MNKALLDSETRYTEIEKHSFALLVAAKKLRPYFQAHPIAVRTEHPIGKALQKGTSTLMAVWSQEMSEYGIDFHPRTAIKAQALADFVAEFSFTPDMGRAENDSTNNLLVRKRKDDPTGPIRCRTD